MRSQVDQFEKEHPWLMRWERFKLSVSCFFWRFHPKRNRWCNRCEQFVGNSREEAKAHKCEQIELIHFKDLPIGAWFRINLAGKPGLAITRKATKCTGVAGDQYVRISEPVWWVKNYTPPADVANST